MITEDYVSFETAKLLKEKGFNEVTSYVFSDKGEILKLTYFAVRDLSNSECDGYPNWHFPIKGVKTIVSAPTLQMAMKWLREEHSLFIGIEIGVCYTFGWEVIKMNDTQKLLKIESTVGTYEEACEAAIKYCLEHLI